MRAVFGSEVGQDIPTNFEAFTDVDEGPMRYVDEDVGLVKTD